MCTLKSCSKDHGNLYLEDAYCFWLVDLINQTSLNFQCQALNPLKYLQKTHYRIPPIGLTHSEKKKKKVRLQFQYASINIKWKNLLLKLFSIKDPGTKKLINRIIMNIYKPEEAGTATLSVVLTVRYICKDITKWCNVALKCKPWPLYNSSWYTIDFVLKKNLILFATQNRTIWSY